MLFTAFDIEEAITKAKAFYKCDEKNLKIQTIKNPYRRFWGLVNKPGEFRIEYIDIEPKIQKKKLIKKEDGKVQILSGKIQVTDPSSEGKYASIIADDPNVEVYINGKRITGIAIVTEKDRIDLKAKNIDPSTVIKVDISSDKLKAILTVEKKAGRKYFVKDTQSENSIYIRSEYDEIPAPNVTVEQCISELIKANVQMKFINIQAIYDLVNSPDGGSSVVAEGKPPVHGLNSKIKYLFQNSNYRNPAFETNEKVDLLSHTIIPTVNIGEVLAIKIMPAMPGTDGESVTGEILKAYQGKDLPLKAGNGTVLLESNTKIVAIASGRPIFKNGIVSVVPVLTIQHDVDVETGNVYFDGDIVIKGNIMDNMQVEAKGNIIIYGNVNHANITTNYNIEVYGNIIGSTVRAGISSINYLGILPKMEQIHGILKELCDKVSTVKPVNYSQIDNQLIQIVNSSSEKLKKCIDDIKNLFAILADEDVKKVSLILNKIQTLFLHINTDFINIIKQIYLIDKDVNNYITEIKKIYDKQANIIFHYAQNSFIQANGNILVKGQGCYQTKLIARNAIVFQQPSSLVRGGILIAGKNIKMGIVGSPSGITTYCRVLDKNGRISAVHCYDKTILNINDNLKKVEHGFPSSDYIKNRM
ncbi:MAG: FapA family protein [Thermoanaerobacteraceae bacterium]|nr:FapA family protein [Thermoanaerobacteraceae bacterium]